MDIEQAIKNRRSIRQYKSDPVPDDLLDAVFEAARWAPSWGNLQCWHFVVVRDPERKERLAATLFGITDRPNRTSESMKQAPVVIAVCAEIGNSGVSYREPRQPVTDKGEYWYMFDAALAMQNLALRAHSLGLGTVIVGAFDARKAAEVLGLPAGVAVVALTPLGFPNETPALRPRKEVSEIVHHDVF